MLAGGEAIQIEFEIPEGALGARLSVAAELQTELSPNSIVRCTVKDGSSLGDTAADTGEVSNILGMAEGKSFETWAENVLQFSRTLPDTSHREPAPSDRDPIPAPFDNTYNSPERNEFHYAIKYHRDDDFLVRYLLDDATREKLQHAWNDLLASFDYHNTYFTFILRKLGREPGDQTIATVRPTWIASLPDESRTLVQELVSNYVESQAALCSAKAGHVDDAIRFAQAAWRRPLTVGETSRLRAFYDQVSGLQPAIARRRHPSTAHTHPRRSRIHLPRGANRRFTRRCASFAMGTC